MWEKILTNRQLEITKDIKLKQPRHVIFEGAVRSGKTILAIMNFISLLKTNTNRLFIMTGQTISSLKRNVLDEMTKLFGIETHLNMNNEFEFNDNKIACFGTDKADSYKSMRGLTASGWYGNEVILSHQNSILEAFARCSDKDAKIIWETNPDKPTHFIKTNYIDKSGSTFEDGTYNILSYHFELEDNTFLDRNYIESLKNAIPKGTVFDRQIKGLWKATDKAVFTNLNFVSKAPIKQEDICYGLDFGYNNPSAMVKIMWYEGNVYIEKIFQQSKLTSSQLVEKVLASVENKHIPIYCDNAEPDKIKDLQNAGLNAKPANKDVQAGIRKLQNEKVLYLIDDIELRRSFENYEFQSNANGEVLDIPIKYDDHLVDSARYGIFSMVKKIDVNQDVLCYDMYEEYVV